MRKISLTAIQILALGALAACRDAAEQPAREARRVSVRVFVAQYESIPRIIEAPGSVQPRLKVLLASQINGSVRELRVKVGDNVRAGQVLMLLDSREAESQKATATASLEEALAALEEGRKGVRVAESMLAASRATADLAAETLSRYEKLHEARSVSPQEIDEVRARREAAAADLAARETMVAAARDRVGQAEARIAQAKAQESRADVVLGWTVVKAPSDGRISEKSADPGSAIFPGSPLLVLESTSGSQALADVPASDGVNLRAGMQVKVRSSDPHPPLVTGTVSEVAPLSDRTTHTVRFKVDLPKGYDAPSGSFVKVEVPAGSREALLVPRPAVRETGQLTGVFVVDAASFARLRLVRLADFDDQRVELLAGVEPGERIVADATGEVAEGVRLEIQP